MGATGVLVNMAVFESVLAFAGGGTHPSSLVVNGAAVAGWLVSVASNFALNSVVTFGHRAGAYQSSRPRRMARYYATAASGLALQLLVLNAVLWTLAEVLPTGADTGGVLALVQAHRLRLANLAGIGAGTVVNYVLSRNWVFK